MTINIELYTQVTAFINMEADMLDHKEYQDWLDLWTETGLYIIPVDANSQNYKDNLNIAYDDTTMRKMRVERLQSGYAVSTKEAKMTVRTLSRIRILEENEEEVLVRCAYCVFENKKNDLRSFPADVEYTLKRQKSGLKIEQKVVKILKADEYLTTIAYLF